MRGRPASLGVVSSSCEWWQSQVPGVVAHEEGHCDRLNAAIWKTTIAGPPWCVFPIAAVAIWAAADMHRAQAPDFGSDVRCCSRTI